MDKIKMQIISKIKEDLVKDEIILSFAAIENLYNEYKNYTETAFYIRNNRKHDNAVLDVIYNVIKKYS